MSGPGGGGCARIGALCAAILGAAVLLLGCAREPEAPRPNLLLLTVDTLRADALECYGGPAGAGSALCSLADQGARFVWAFSTASATTPSVTSILTSRYPGDHGVSQAAGSALPAGVPTLAETLSRAGYATAAVVSNPTLGRFRKLDAGFDRYDDEMDTPVRNRTQSTERAAASTTDTALAALATLPQPWFLWVHFQDPHGPYEPPDAEPVAEDEGGETLPVLDDHSGRGGIPAYQVLPGATTRGAYARRYREEIRYLDHHVARLLSAVDARGATGVIVTADHGEAFGEDGFYFAHGHSLGLEQIRVPLMWRPPQSAEATRVERPVSGIDIAPTLLAAAGLKIPSDFAGQSLDETPGQPRPLFAEHARRSAVVANGHYYARDRRPGDAGRPDPSANRKQPALPWRTARLAGTSLPPYEAAGIHGAELEATLAAHLGGDPVLAGAGSASEGPVSDETRERLAALGYTE